MITSDTILQELEKFTYNAVVSSHSQNIAIAAARSVFNCLWVNLRNQVVYIPVSDGVDKIRRNKAILNDFNGSNHRELSIKYRLSFQAIYSILRKARQANPIKNNAPIFTSPKIECPATLHIIYEYLPTELIKIGITENNANSLCANIVTWLCENFPGVSFCISDKLNKKHIEKGYFLEFNNG